VGQLLLMSGQQRRMMRGQAVAVPVSLALNFLLIPRTGLIGAAVAAAVTNALLNLLWLRDVKKTLSLAPRGRGYISLLLPGAATLVAVWFVRMGFTGTTHHFLSVIAGMVAGYAVFILSALVAGLDSNDRMLARSAWQQVRRSFGSDNA